MSDSPVEARLARGASPRPAPVAGWRPVAALCIGLVVPLLIASGCGPVRSTQAISEAETEFERARVAQAHDKAPYEYHSARQYLHKAKEEWGYSEFQAAIDFAEQAERAAESARRKAKEDPWEDPVEGRNGEEADEPSNQQDEQSSPADAPDKKQDNPDDGKTDDTSESTPNS